MKTFGVVTHYEKNEFFLKMLSTISKKQHNRDTSSSSFFKEKSFNKIRKILQKQTLSMCCKCLILHSIEKYRQKKSKVINVVRCLGNPL